LKTGQFIHDKFGLIRWSATWDPTAPSPFRPPAEEAGRRGAGTIQFWDPFDVWLGAVVFDSWTQVKAASIGSPSEIAEAIRWFEQNWVHIPVESTPLKVLQRLVENWFGAAAREIAGVIVEEQSNAG
jgi:hypothetical protein